MNIEIDQSGRVEYTSHRTVIAFSNDRKMAIMIKAADKREIQNIFRKMGKGKIFVIRLFTILIFFLLKKEKKINKITIDIEYPGWDSQIKNYLLVDLRKFGIRLNPDQISFSRITKKSEAHWHAYRVFKKERTPEIIIGVKEVLNELFRVK